MPYIGQVSFENQHVLLSVVGITLKLVKINDSEQIFSVF